MFTTVDSNTTTLESESVRHSIILTISSVNSHPGFQSLLAEVTSTGGCGWFSAPAARCLALSIFEDRLERRFQLFIEVWRVCRIKVYTQAVTYYNFKSERTNQKVPAGLTFVAATVGVDRTALTYFILKAKALVSVALTYYNFKSERTNRKVPAGLTFVAAVCGSCNRNFQQSESLKFFYQPLE